MRTFLVAVNLPVGLWNECLDLPELGKDVSDMLEATQPDLNSWEDWTGFKEWNVLNAGCEKRIMTISLDWSVAPILAGWDEDCDDSVIGFICSEIVKNLS